MNPKLHEGLQILSELYYSGEISEEEWDLLQIHMAYCDPCYESSVYFLWHLKATAVPPGYYF